MNSLDPSTQPLSVPAGLTPRQWSDLVAIALQNPRTTAEIRDDNAPGVLAAMKDILLRAHPDGVWLPSELPSVQAIGAAGPVTEG